MSAALSAALLAPPSRAQGSPLPVFGELGPVHAESVPTGLCVTRTGRYVLTGEGGTLSVLDTLAPNGMRDPVDHFPVSSRGIVPVAMMLDPDANLENGPNDPGDVYDFVYVAAGRDGLWLLSIDDSWSGGGFARRVDDSGNQAPSTQGGRRWRQDLDLVSVGGVRYLATIGAKLDKNFLRLFPLDAVRAVATYPSETGGEIAPKVQVQIPGRVPQQGATDGRAYAYGMAVDPNPTRTLPTRPRRPMSTSRWARTGSRGCV